MGPEIPKGKDMGGRGRKQARGQARPKAKARGQRQGEKGKEKVGKAGTVAHPVERS